MFCMVANPKRFQSVLKTLWVSVIVFILYAQMCVQLRAQVIMRQRENGAVVSVFSPAGKIKNTSIYFVIHLTNVGYATIIIVLRGEHYCLQ